MPRFCWLAQTYYSLKTIIQMALNANEEEKVRQLLTAFESGKRISELDAATGTCPTCRLLWSMRAARRAA